MCSEDIISRPPKRSTVIFFHIISSETSTSTPTPPLSIKCVHAVYFGSALVTCSYAYGSGRSITIEAHLHIILSCRMSFHSCGAELCGSDIAGPFSTLYQVFAQVYRQRYPIHNIINSDRLTIYNITFSRNKNFNSCRT